MPIDQYILSPSAIKKLLLSSQTSPTKKRGQNFLVDPKIISQVVTALKLDSQACVVEIGPGLGALSIPISLTVKHLWLYEIDKIMAGHLQERIEEYDLNERISLINKDFLSDDSQMSGPEDYKVVSSLPYNVTSPILHKLINDLFSSWSTGVFIMQKEVMDKIVQGAPKSSYWHHYIANYYQVECINRKIPPSAFWPQPKVNSGIIKLIKKDDPRITPPGQWSTFLHDVFKHPRKKIGSYLNRDYLVEAGIDANKRAGELELVELQSLFQSS